jgi:hypothetical protein
MLVVRTVPGGPWVITQWTYMITSLCDNDQEVTSAFGIGRADFPIVDGYAAFVSGSLTWTGRFSHTQARGTVQHKTVHCDSGLLSWTADHLHQGGSRGR